MLVDVEIRLPCHVIDDVHGAEADDSLDGEIIDGGEKSRPEYNSIRHGPYDGRRLSCFFYVGSHLGWLTKGGAYTT